MTMANNAVVATIVVIAVASVPETSAAASLGYHHGDKASFSVGFVNNRLPASPPTHRGRHRCRQHLPSSPSSSASFIRQVNHASCFDTNSMSNNAHLSMEMNRSSSCQSRTTSTPCNHHHHLLAIQQRIIHRLRKITSHAAEYTKIISLIPMISSLFTTILLSFTFWLGMAQSSWAAGNAPAQYTSGSSSTSLLSPSSSLGAATTTTSTADIAPTRIQTNQRRSEPYSISSYPRSRTKAEYRQFIQGRLQNRIGRRLGRTKYTKNHEAAVQRISLFVLSATMAASTYRATQLRTTKGSSKPIRSVTPFGIIRNQSPLGNGVSVIRVSMALEFDNAQTFASSGRNNNRDDEDVEDDAMVLLKRLYLEERELYTKIAMLAKQQSEMNQRQSQPQEVSSGMSMGTYKLKQKALVDYVSNGENVIDSRVSRLIYLFAFLIIYYMLCPTSVV